MPTNQPIRRALSTAHRLPLLLLLLAPGFLLGACGGEPERGLVVLNFTSDPDRPFFHDFGNVPFGEQVEHTFQIQNTDSRPVAIQDLLSSCACSAPRVSYRDAAGELVVGKRKGEPVIVLPPGVVADVRIEIESKHIERRNIDKLAQVRLRCDSTTTPYITFEMHILVELDFQATPLVINLGEVPFSSGGRGLSEVVTGRRGQPQRITGVAEQTAGLQVQIEEEPRLGETVWRVVAALEPPLALGTWVGKISLSTTGADGTGTGRLFEIPVHARVVSDVVIRPEPLGFSPFSAIDGARAEARVLALTPGHRVKVTGAHLEGNAPDGLELDWEGVEVDSFGRSAVWGVSLSLPPSYSGGRFAGKLIVELDDPELPRIEAAFHFIGS